MKKFRIFFPLLALILLAACNNDPKMMILANPVAPVLNAPSHSTSAYNKDSAAYVLNMDSTGLADTFTGTAANYGIGTTVTYSLQIDKTGDNFANAQTVTSATTDSLPVTISQLYTIITDAKTFNAPAGVRTSFDIRVMTTIGASKIPTYSNTQTLIIIPILSLKSYTIATPSSWYIIGMGDGKWNYSKDGIGASMFPLSVVSGKAYLNSGAGTFTYTGYFEHANPFKVVDNSMSWSDPSWGSSDGALTPVLSSSSKNFVVPSDGYYTITLNSITNTFTIVAATAPSVNYTSMGLIGEFNGWASDVALTAADPAAGANNHIWYTTYTFTSDFTPPVGTGGCKFRADGAWTYNWGAGTFPIGLGTNGGTNIPFLKGTYKVFFNDIDGCFYFIQ
ncbi:SusE domain-containing protein [Microbacter margulisiae]|uniref:SusE outer membrane protein domain-containing protein n=1 Tax=Microbacter margulisiae TaxID=1350067 RepID=A0A7W5DQC4_9PORP|nr:SusE domain-containing protein [Microbacter margulisiae]MBB3187072.1 hypothetical protein [Microbacter margulisiae]